MNKISSKKSLKILSQCFLLSAALFSFQIFISCKNSSKKPQLELSFSKSLDKVPLSYLSSLIGIGSGKEESFGEEKSLLVFFEEEDCSTCKKVRPFVEEFALKTNCRVYSYQESEDDGAEDKKNFLKKLGSSNGTELTAARLVAFVNGRRVASISGSFDLESEEKIETFAKRFFSFPGKIASSKQKEISGLKELRQLCASEENFVLYLSRFSCPYCRTLEDTKNFNTITFLAKNLNAPIYKITTENALSELNKEIEIDGKIYKTAFDYLEEVGGAKNLWADEKNQKKKTEILEILCALKLVQPSPADDCEFLKGIAEYSLSKAELFTNQDRNVPCFCIYKSTFSDTNEVEIQKILQEVYEKSVQNEEQKENFLHRARFLKYFSASSELGAQTYNSYLLSWASSVLF